MTPEVLDAGVGVDRGRLAALTAREADAFASVRPRSRELAGRARGSLLGGVPMTWMMRWAGPYPLFLAEAKGARVVDVDGHEYVDLCLGDTGAMAGHAPEPVVRAVAERAAAGITAMLPTEDAAWAGEELARRFGLPLWQFTLSATDANRFAIRVCRAVTGRPKIIVFNGCYHGTVDETFATLRADGSVGVRPGNVGPPVDPALTTKVVELNDLDALEAALAPGDVACVLAEPALTNIGIVLPDPGFHEALRELTRRTGTLLVIDETHTFSAGPGGYTAAHGLEPDVLTIGKAIGGGVPVGAFGGRRELMEQVTPLGPMVHFGTYNANPLAMAAGLACLTKVMTDDTYKEMTRLTTRLADGMRDVFKELGVTAHVVQLNTLGGLFFGLDEQPTNFREAARNDAARWDDYWFGMLNRGVIPMGSAWFEEFSMSAQHTDEDVDRTLEAFEECIRAISA